MFNNRFSSCLLIVLLSAMTIAVAPATQAQDSSAGGNGNVVAFGVPDAQQPMMKMIVIGFTSATLGGQIAGFPCMGGATGCADAVTGTVAIPTPLAADKPGDLVSYTFQFHDISYKGSCSLNYKLTEYKKVLATGRYVFPNGCTPKTQYYASFNVKQPGQKGVATLKATLQAGMHGDTVLHNFCIQ